MLPKYETFEYCSSKKSTNIAENIAALEPSRTAHSTLNPVYTSFLTAASSHYSSSVGSMASKKA